MPDAPIPRDPTRDTRTPEELAPRKPSPEDLARRQIGTTEVSGRGALVLVVVAIALVFVPPSLHLSSGAAESWADFLEPPRRLDSATALHDLLVERIAALEEGLEDSSPIREAVRAPYHRLLVATRFGTPQVAVGRDGWLYLRSGLAHLTGPPALAPRRESAISPNPSRLRTVDPRPALVALDRDLHERGIRLLVVLAPTKAAVVPGPLVGPDGPKAPLANPSTTEILGGLREAGLDVLDGTTVLAPLGPAAFLRVDSHWSPAGVDAVAEAIAERVDRLGLAFADPPKAASERSVVVSSVGDLGRLVDATTEEEVTIRPVTLEGEEARIPGAEVLVVGDSFSNVFSSEHLDWGADAGLAERLASRLGRPVDRLAVDDGGDVESRQALARAAAGSRLDRVRVLVLELAARELSGGHWPIVPLSRAEPTKSGTNARTQRPGPSAELLRVEVLASAESNRDGPSPYRDELVALRVRVLEPDERGELLLYGRSRIDGEPGPFARTPTGAVLEVRVVAWEDAEDEERSLQRIELDDDSWLLPASLILSGPELP